LLQLVVIAMQATKPRAVRKNLIDTFMIYNALIWTVNRSDVLLDNGYKGEIILIEPLFSQKVN